MKALSASPLLDLTMDIFWEKEGIRHHERYFADKLNCWRDVVPRSPLDTLLNRQEHPEVPYRAQPGELVPGYSPDNVIHIPWSRMNTLIERKRIKKGRFYPRGILKGFPGIFSADMTPFRCIAVHEHGITADLNHPMAKAPLSVTLDIAEKPIRYEERGGSCTDWMELALTGPGMQANPERDRTDFFSGTPFERRDESPDTVFYETDRFVHHIDATARQNLSDFYTTILRPGDSVLDLMAGWQSHLPGNIDFRQVHGLGLNRNELEKNRSLTDRSLQDLNSDPVMPFSDHTFDAVICSLSMEYLTHPLSVFREAGRVLKPAGTFAVTFSNRWFPEKTIALWEELHEFERLGFALNCFLAAGCFEAVSTFSVRGYPRPADDKYYPGLRLSDPVYAVTAKKTDGRP